MTALLRATGCCPVCDERVPRILASIGSASHELYECPTDGTIGYGSQPVSLAAWIASVS